MFLWAELPTTPFCHGGALDPNLFTLLTETNLGSSTHRVLLLSPPRLARFKSGRSLGPRPVTHIPAHPVYPSAHRDRPILPPGAERIHGPLNNPARIHKPALLPWY
ncbi:hypothetical protein AOLI_G00195010 [Acnodon oligacanthus]